jgi:putative ABC transport system ATP-binding protein
VSQNKLQKRFIVKMTASTSKNQDIILEIKDLEFSYSGGPAILKINDLQIKRGEKIFIFGPSGSGKTTLLGLLAGVLGAKKGSIKILGHDLAQMTASQRDGFRGNHIGYIFQMFNLIPYLSVRDNIKLSCALNHKRLDRLRSSGDVEKNCRNFS